MLIRLCYASTRVEGDKNLIEDLDDILTTARRFNQNHQIFGVLYYADGQFFQCLEGKQVVLNALFKNIMADPRHQQVVRFNDQEIQRVHFSKWSMKYVKDTTRISRFFAKCDLAKFQPDLLDENQRADFVSLLLKINK